MTPILQFLVALALILVAAKLGGYISLRLGLPAVLGELVAGLLLGPTALDLLHLFPSESLGEIIGHLAELGVVVLMFLAGLETDVADLNRVRLTAILSGTLGVVVPILMAVPVGLAFGLTMEVSIFLGLVLAATSVSISARTLMELGALRRREGFSILGAAVVDDVLAILALSVFIAVAVGGGDGAGAGVESVLFIFARILIYFAVAVAVGYFLLPRLTRWIADLPIAEGLSSFSLVVMLVFAWSAEAGGGVAMITGAFLAGLLFTRTEARTQIEERVSVLAYSFLVPIFFINIGLTANMRAFDADAVLLLVALTIIAVASKIIGCGGGARLSGLSWLESLRVGTGMISRGEVGLIIASLGVSSQIVDNELFSVFVVVVLISTLVTPLLLKWVFSGDSAQVSPAGVAQ